MTSAVSAALQQLNQIILGKPEQLKLALSCLLADGHLLIEDLPGMGKTTLAHALAGVLGLNYNRIQFTSDLLPADILGVSIFEKEPGSDLGRFRFHEGPVFSQLLLADEINRATPKSQSALLEAMEERQVTVEGESQLDRFLMRISLGYPSEQAERQLLEGASRRDMANQLQAQITPQQLQQLQRQVRDIHASASVLDYLQRIIAFSRYESGYLYGLSPRGALALLQAARAWALVHERQHVLPEDIQAVLPAVVDHRLADAAEGGAHSVSARILNSVAVLV